MFLHSFNCAKCRKSSSGSSYDKIDFLTYLIFSTAHPTQGHGAPGAYHKAGVHPVRGAKPSQSTIAHRFTCMLREHRAEAVFEPTIPVANMLTTEPQCPPKILSNRDIFLDVSLFSLKSFHA